MDKDSLDDVAFPAGLSDRMKADIRGDIGPLGVLFVPMQEGIAAEMDDRRRRNGYPMGINRRRLKKDFLKDFLLH